MTVETQAKKAASDLQGKFGGLLHEISEGSSKAAAAISKGTDNLVNSTKKHPGLALAAAAGVGFLAALILKRR